MAKECECCHRTGDNHEYCPICELWYCVYHIDKNNHDCKKEAYTIKENLKQVNPYKKIRGGFYSKNYFKKILKDARDNCQNNEVSPNKPLDLSSWEASILIVIIVITLIILFIRIYKTFF